jgi:hypothetical protein
MSRARFVVARMMGLPELFKPRGSRSRVSARSDTNSDRVATKISALTPTCCRTAVAHTKPARRETLPVPAGQVHADG